MRGWVNTVDCHVVAPSGSEKAHFICAEAFCTRRDFCYQKNLWFNADGSNSDPSDPAGYGVSGLQVNIASSDSQLTVAGSIKATVKADSGGSVIGMIEG